MKIQKQIPKLIYLLILLVPVFGAYASVKKPTVTPMPVKEVIEDPHVPSHDDLCGLDSVECGDEVYEKNVRLKKDTFKAIRTKYSRKDSCHYPQGSKCLTAIGKDTTEDRTVACPYSLKLGTKIVLSDEPNKED